MTTFEGLSALAGFWSEFSNTPLYDTGFGDAIQACGADRGPDPLRPADEQRVDALIGMAYLIGYANAARLANVYMTPGWQIAQLLAIAAGTFRVHLETNELTPERVRRLAHTYRAELLDLCREKRGAA